MQHQPVELMKMMGIASCRDQCSAVQVINVIKEDIFGIAIDSQHTEISIVEYRYYIPTHKSTTPFKNDVIKPYSAEY